jgi:y4mF family transcriptional regulator
MSSNPPHIDTPAELGSVIRARRRALGLTQVELAAAANTSVRFVSEVERGKSTARVAGLFRLLEALGLRMRAEPR